MRTTRTKAEVLKNERRLLITVVAGVCLIMGAAALGANEYLELHKSWYDNSAQVKLLTAERDTWRNKTMRFAEEMHHVDREMSRYDDLIEEVMLADGCRKKLRKARKELKKLRK